MIEEPLILKDNPLGDSSLESCENDFNIGSLFGDFRIEDFVNGCQFKFLPDDVQQFLFVLSKYIIKNDINYENFNKIEVTENNEFCTVLEWNFVKIRTFYYFDHKDEQNSEICFIVNDNGATTTRRLKLKSFNYDFEFISNFICELIKKIVYGRL